MKNITYLFGAGASCQRMPLNIEIPDRIYQRSATLNATNLNIIDVQDFKKELIADLHWIAEEASNHASIDTYAKKLYIKRDFEKLKRLRLALSAFFSLEQVGKIPDKRYDSFFASILNDSPNSLPTNIKVLNWNYDFQFELSFMRFADVSLNDAQSYLGCVHKNRDFYTDLFKNDKFEIYKLNGDCSITEGESTASSIPLTNDLSGPLTQNNLAEIITKWHNQKKIKNSLCSNISFAWEKNGNGFLEYIAKKIQKTNILIVIGYSFPFFNREIDMSLIKKMPELQKVYLQSPQASDIEERFRAMNDNNANIDVVKIFDIGQFHLPFELSKGL